MKFRGFRGRKRALTRTFGIKETAALEKATAPRILTGSVFTISADTTASAPFQLGSSASSLRSRFTKKSTQARTRAEA
jgi:hypothetical protein